MYFTAVLPGIFMFYHMVLTRENEEAAIEVSYKKRKGLFRKINKFYEKEKDAFRNIFIKRDKQRHNNTEKNTSKTRFSSKKKETNIIAQKEILI